MTILFVAGIAAWLLYRSAGRASTVQSGRAFALLIGFLAILAAAEWWLYLSGDIYSDGIAWQPMVKPLLFIAFITSLGAWRNARARAGATTTASRFTMVLVLAALTAAFFLI